MKRDEMLGYFIQALRNYGLDRKEIEKIIEDIMSLEDNIKDNEARSIFYDFPE